MRQARKKPPLVEMQIFRQIFIIHGGKHGATHGL
jgi:hypothetical protein